MASRYYLDTDTTPTIKSRYAYKGLQATIDFALGLVGRCDEGQIGIYTTHLGDGFKGYAINDGKSPPYFEAAKEPTFDQSNSQDCPGFVEAFRVMP